MRASLQWVVAPFEPDKVRRAFDLGNEPTPEANRYGVGSAARLELRQQVTDMRFDGLLGEEEPLADLAVDETVGHELQNLDLPRGRLLLEFPLHSGRKRDHRAGPR